MGVVTDLIRKVAALEKADCEPDPIEWFVKTYGTQPDYSDLVDRLAPTQDQRQQILRGYFEPTEAETEEGAKQPTKAHNAIAKLAAQGFIRVILTTNFDRLMERALDAEGVTPVVISSKDGILGAMPLIHQKCTVIKLHGDYLSARLSNTVVELSEYDPVIASALDRILDEHGLIVAGWSGEWDVALRQAIERCPNRRFGFYWTSISEPGKKAQQQITLRAGQAIRVADADTFSGHLREKVQALSDSMSDHPVSIEAAIALVKRYCSKPEHRIRLHDLLLSETTAALTDAEAVLAKWEIAQQPKGYRNLLNPMHQILGKLRMMLATAAYWGGRDVMPVLLKCMERISYEPLAQARSGSLRGYYLRAFLGMSLMFPAGIGFILARDYVGAATLAKESMTDGLREREHLITLFTYNHDHLKTALNDKQAQKLVFPFHDLMVHGLAEELKSLYATLSVYRDAYDEWELVIALIHGEITNASISTHHWVSPGFYVFGLKQEMRSRMFPSINETDTVELAKATKGMRDLVGAGFFGGDWNRVLDLRACVLKTAMNERFF